MATVTAPGGSTVVVGNSNDKITIYGDGTVKAGNVVMLGAVAAALPFPAEAMEAVIRRSVPAKTVDLNLEAFRLGRTVAACS